MFIIAASHFNVEEWETDSIRILKQEDFCGATALIYFVEILLRFALTAFKNKDISKVLLFFSKNKSIYL